MTARCSHHLAGLERRLTREGYADAARRLREIRREVALQECPPTWFGRVGAKLAAALRPQWERFLQEIEETGDAAELLRRASRGGGSRLNEAERRRLRAQVSDVLKLVPSTAIFVGLFFVPMPGAQALTPAVLARLGLLPSAWRESYVLHGLDELAARLGDVDGGSLSATLTALRRRIAAEATEREELRRFFRRNPDHVLLFDDDFDGRLDESEMIGAVKALDAVRAAARSQAVDPRWYAFLDDVVHGPCRLADFDAAPFRAGALVCYGRSSRWAPLDAVLTSIGRNPHPG